MRFYILILSCHRYPARREACRETWLPRLLPDMRYRFYIGEGPGVNEPDVVQLSVPDTYEGLREKTPAALAHALQFEWDWLFKCDDDTYVVPERLEDTLRSVQLYPGYTKREIRWGEPHYVGCVTRPGDFYGYGGGYFLDRWLVNRIVSSEPTNCIVNADMIAKGIGEDGWIGHVARKCSRYWCTEKINNNSKPTPTIYNDLATCHSKDPISMRQAHLAYIQL